MSTIVILVIVYLAYSFWKKSQRTIKDVLDGPEIPDIPVPGEPLSGDSLSDNALPETQPEVYVPEESLPEAPAASPVIENRKLEEDLQAPEKAKIDKKKLIIYSEILKAKYLE